MSNHAYSEDQLVEQPADWEHPDNNDFLLVSQFSVTGTLYTCRPDLVGFVNGLPWVVIELKKPGVPARAAFDKNLTHCKQQIPALFWSNALLIASNGTDSRFGSLTAEWGCWVERKRIEREDEPRHVSLEVMLRGICDPTRNAMRACMPDFRNQNACCWMSSEALGEWILRLHGLLTGLPARSNTFLSPVQRPAESDRGNHPLMKVGAGDTAISRP